MPSELASYVQGGAVAWLKETRTNIKELDGAKIKETARQAKESIRGHIGPLK